MFYGWKLCGLTSMGNFLLQGSIIYVMNAFTEPLNALYGWTRAEISIGMSIAAFLGALSIPVWSALILRYNLRLLMTIGTLIGGLSLITLSFTSNIWVFYICYTLIWASGQSFGGATANILMNQWFDKEKGRAFGITNFGTSFSGAIVPFILMIVIMEFDVQTAWFGYGFLVLCFVPICWFFICDTPEEMGLHVDNIPQDTSKTKSIHIKLSVRDVLSKPPVYVMGFIFGFALLGGSAVVSQLKPRMVDIGLDSYTAMTFSCLTALMLAFAKYFWGWLCDKYNPIAVTRLVMFLLCVSFSLVFLPPSLPALLTFCIFFGATLGGVWVLMPAVVAFYFGKDNFIYYYRIVSTFIMLKAVGFSLLGISYTLMGSYDFAYYIFEGIFFICLLLTFLLKLNPNDDKYVNNVIE